MKTPCVLRCLQFLVLGSSFRLSRGYCWQAGWNPKFIDLPKIQQVRSLTRFQSQLAFYKQRSAVKICACFKHTIKICISCFRRCPGTSAPNETHLPVSIYPWSLRSNRGGKVGALEDHPVSSKSTSGRSWQRQGSCWKEQNRKMRSICPFGKLIILF